VKIDIYIIHYIWHSGKHR